MSFREPPVEPGPLYAMPTAALFGTALAAVSLGIARHAIDILLELAQTRTTGRSRGQALRQDATVQANLGHAEALLRSGRAFLYEALEEAWQLVVAGRPLSPGERGTLWLASTHAANAAKQATELMFSAGSSASPYASCGLARCVRDIDASAQHISVALGNHQEPVKRSSVWTCEQACCSLPTIAACRSETIRADPEKHCGGFHRNTALRPPGYIQGGVNSAERGDWISAFPVCKSLDFRTNGGWALKTVQVTRVDYLPGISLPPCTSRVWRASALVGFIVL